MLKIFKNLSIRNKVFIVVSVTIIILFIIISNIISVFLTINYSAIENQYAEKNVIRATNAFQDKITSLSLRIKDWSQWDETYDFARGINNDFVKKNLNIDIFKGLGINFIVITDISNNVIYKQIYDNNGIEKTFSEKLDKYFTPESNFINFDNQKKYKHDGIVIVPEGVVIMASTQITPTSGVGKPIGSLTFGMFFDDYSLEPLSQLTQLDLSYALYKDTNLKNDFLKAKKNLSIKKTIFIEETKNPDIISGYSLISNINKEPVLILKIEMDRQIYKSGQKNIAFFNILIFIVGIFFLATVLLLFEFLVIRRLLQIKNEVETIGKIDCLNTRLKISGSDEFSQLSFEINKMLDKLKENDYKKNELEKSKFILDKAIAKQNKELNQKVLELKKINETMVNRELVMIELKKKIDELENKLKI